MPHFTLQIIDGGPVLSAFVGVSQARAGALASANQPVPQNIPIRALVDTGASCTCVDPSILDKLQLTPTGTVLVNTPSTASQPHAAFQYDVQIIIPGGSAAHAPLWLPNVAVTASELVSQQGFHALVGRDILHHCVLVCNGATRLFTVAY